MLHHINRPSAFGRVVRILCVLVLAVYLVASLLEVPALKNSEAEGQKKLLESYQTYFDDLEDTLATNVYWISQLSETLAFASRPESQELSSLFRLSQKLRSFCTDPMMENICLYFPGGEYIYLYDESIYREDDYFDQRIPALEESERRAQWLGIWKTPPTRGETPHDVVAYMIPCSVNTGLPSQQDYWVGYYLSTERLNRINGLMASGDQVLFAYAGDELIHTTDGFPFRENALSAIVEEKGWVNEGAIHDAITLEAAQSISVGMLVLHRTRISYLMECLGNNVGLLLGMLLGALTLSGAYYLVLMLFSRSILARMNTDPVQEKPEIVGAMGMLLDKADEYAAMMKHYDDLMKDKRLVSLLLGPWPEDMPAVPEIAQDMPCHAVLMVMAEKTDHAATNEKVAYVNEYLIRSLRAMGEVVSVILNNGEWALILSTQQDLNTDGKERFIAAIREIHDHVQNLVDLSLLFSLGVTVASSSQLYQSFSAARGNLDALSNYENEFYTFSEGEVPLLPHERPWEEQILKAVIDRDTQMITAAIAAIPAQTLEADGQQGRVISGMLFASLASGLWERGIALPFGFLSYVFNRISGEETFDAYAFLPDAIGRMTAVMNGETGDSIRSQRVNQTISFIHEHYVDNISVTNIADAIGVNAIHLNRIFKYATGKAIGEYLNLYRVGIAKTLLENPKLTIAEIGRTVGYNDPRSLINQYRKFMGITPGDYRRQILQFKGNEPISPERQERSDPT